MATKKIVNESGHADLHIVPQADGWMIEVADEHARTFRTQAEAIEAAKRLAGEQVDIVVHGRDGRARHIVSKSPADEMMLDFWKNVHAEDSAGKSRARKAS